MDIPQQNTCMDGKVRYPLFSLFNQRIFKNLPSQILRNSLYLFQSLVYWHRSDWNWGISNYPLAGFMYVLTSRKVHDGVSTQRHAQTAFSTSSSILELTALLPMLALIFTKKFRPMIIGSLSGWLMLLGIMALPAAISSRTNSGVINFGVLAPKLSPLC